MNFTSHGEEEWFCDSCKHSHYPCKKQDTSLIHDDLFTCINEVTLGMKAA